jgi:hydroxymethylglutaryl-CoA lyase
VNLAAAIEAARVAERLVGHQLPSALPRAGDRIRYETTKAP